MTTRNIVHSGSVRDIRQTLLFARKKGTLTIPRLEDEITHEQRYKNRSTVIAMLQREIKKLYNCNGNCKKE